MEIKQLTRENFTLDSLKDFNRFQVVEDIYVLRDGELLLSHSPFTETWSPERRIEKAGEILSGEFTVFGAFEGDRVVGELMLVPELHKGRMIVDSFHVCHEFRRKGIGRALFKAAVEEARKNGARALYISACSAKETIDFYRAMGCHVSADPIPECVEDEPCDIQMECDV